MFRSPSILQGTDLANGFMGSGANFMNAMPEIGPYVRQNQGEAQ